MLARNIRRFTTTACRAAETVSQMESGNQYGIQVSKAQGHVNGLVGGKLQIYRSVAKKTVDVVISPSSNWQYASNPPQPPF